VSSNWLTGGKEDAPGGEADNPSRLRLDHGTRLGPYEVISPIGSGAMGEVWEGRDSRLDRRAVINVAREQFSDRFDREARAVAALNHPRHGIQSTGKPLAGPLPLADAFRAAIQIVDALEAAHRNGITRRDLKPAKTSCSPGRA
jgi:eukaryotic-like serine/threonine-protein kinase